MDAQLYGPDLDDIASQTWSEYEMNMKAVESTFGKFIFHTDVSEVPVHDVASALTKMLRVRFRNKAPRRPPRVAIVGPPGSGRSTQAELLSRKFGLVWVCPRHLVKAECEKNPGIKLQVKEAIENGEPIPDSLILRLVDDRLKQSDCRLNGWVLDGFPQNEE